MQKNNINPKKELNINPKEIFAFFDFDGTLIKKESFALFLLFSAGYLKVILNIIPLLYSYILYKLDIITNMSAKERAITKLLKGFSKEYLENLAKAFATKKLDKLINPQVYSRLEYHLEHGHTIVIVSANLSLYLNYWSRMHNVDEVLASVIDYEDGVCNGKLVGLNCYGKQKVKRIIEYLNHNKLNMQYSYGYGNSKGDYEMLFYTDEAYWFNGNSLIPWSEYKNDRKSKRK